MCSDPMSVLKIFGQSSEEQGSKVVCVIEMKANNRPEYSMNCWVTPGNSLQFSEPQFPGL